MLVLQATRDPVGEGDMIVLDFGGLKDRYGSDMTRTAHVDEPAPEQRAIHEMVREAQQAAFDAVRPGIACQEIDRVARKLIADVGYSDQFMVGGESRELEPGMCFSIESGTYLPDRFGVRIEDIVAVTPNGGGRLNHTGHAMYIVLRSTECRSTGRQPQRTPAGRATCP
jgi:Xaa-Pro aminopeptidase